MQLRSLLPSSVLVGFLALGGCVPSTEGDSDGSGGRAGTGGTTGSGGASAGSGGAQGSGGAPGSGGMPGSGGSGSGGRGSGGSGSGGSGSGGSGSGGRGDGGNLGGGGRGTGGGGGGGRSGSGGGQGGGGGGAGGGATFAQVAMLLGSSCGTGMCHTMTSGHVVLVNDAGLYDRLVMRMPSGTNVDAQCTSRTLVVPGNPAMSLLSEIVKAAPAGGCATRMPNMCSPSGGGRACLTTAQIATIDSWIMANAPR